MSGEINSLQFYDRTTFDDIPERKGVYAFFLNFEYLLRAYNNSPQTPVDVPTLLEKTRRAHTLCDPGLLSINMYGKSTKFGSRLDLDSRHEIAFDAERIPAPDQFYSVASALARCTLLTPPLYIGITLKQTFLQRFKQHEKKYGRYKCKVGMKMVQPPAEMDRQGRFFEKLVRRRVEFRDLAFVCVPLAAGELPHIKYVESLLQAMSNPPMSTSH